MLKQSGLLHWGGSKFWGVADALSDPLGDVPDYSGLR